MPVIIRNAEQLRNQIAKARQLKPLVRFIRLRHYDVRNSQGSFNRVYFFMRDHLRMSICERPDGTECPASAHGRACVHMCSALPHHVMTMADIFNARKAAA